MRETERFTPPESERRIITLADVMDPSREIPNEYKELIARAEVVSGVDRKQARKILGNSEPYSDFWAGRDGFEHAKLLLHPRTTWDFLRERLVDNVLVDLGSGKENDYVPGLARYFGVSTYIGVDRYNIGDRYKKKADPLVPFKETDVENLHKIYVIADMLDFVSRMRDSSANFILNGIDDFFIQPEKYGEVLAQELVRATTPMGIIFGFGSGFSLTLNRHLDDMPLRLKTDTSELNGAFVFEKQESKDK